ncbi:MAG: metallophosphoesterase, partial [Lentisphaeria bacterium]|nr:metallophosphoesterase [Lentisphaeria bacterium]
MMKSILSLWLFFILGSAFLLRGSEDYNFFMISDTHFGTAGTFCTDPKAPKKHRTRKNIHRADRTMPHYRNLFRQIRETADAKTRFLVEGGDLIEGCTRNETVHKQVLTDAVNLMKEYFKFPIYMIKGNHEAAGNGGEKAYQAVLLPEMAKYAHVSKLEEANYVIRQGRDVYIYLDYTSGNWFSFLEKTLSSLKEKPRWVFTVIHCPLLPTWAFRKYALRTIELLSQYDGILLCGHHHANTVTRYEKAGKRVTQITVSTILQPVSPLQMRMR